MAEQGGFQVVFAVFRALFQPREFKDIRVFYNILRHLNIFLIMDLYEKGRFVF
ncbi:MAG: hypothetical protein FD189_2307 [Elusimicrobia bacterium]|nr:MAG: hypothetical protein FD154_2317 [Elusimicrobiota bacterium]KAF0153746.1 MAG: hypothetical protein FD189_2307 [Elusimicrobiota bacterium]